MAYPPTVMRENAVVRAIEASEELGPAIQSLTGIDTSQAFWLVCKERGAKLHARRPRGATYCAFCDKEYRTGFASSGAHVSSADHVANVLAAVERARGAA